MNSSEGIHIQGLTKTYRGPGGPVPAVRGIDLTIAPAHGWSSVTLAWVAGGLALFGAFLVVEHRCAAPMMPLALFRARAFSVLNGMTLLLYFAVSGALYLLPFELIRVDGYSTTAAGAALVPFAVVMGVLASSAGRLARRHRRN